MDTQTNRLMTMASVQAIMKRRSLIASSHIGKAVVFTIQGNGNVIDVKGKDGQPVLSKLPGEEGFILRKKIFNTRANSQVAMSNPRNQDFLREGIRAEKAGDAQAAHEAYNEYLNATQVSIGILLPSAKADKLADGVEVSAKVELITTENGSLLTVDPTTISVVAPEVLGKTTFNIDDFMPAETAEEKALRLKAEAAAAKKAAKAGTVGSALKA